MLRPEFALLLFFESKFGANDSTGAVPPPPFRLNYLRDTSQFPFLKVNTFTYILSFSTLFLLWQVVFVFF